MRNQEIIGLWEAYNLVYEQETGRGPRISDTYDMRDAEGGPKGGRTIKGPKMKNVIRKEEIDLFDTILEHLVAEGYADTNESALVIMANMSEEWRQSIIDEGKVELKQRNKNEMQRKAGNLGREVVSTPNTKKNAVKRGAAMNRMGKLVSAIASDDEDKRFDRMPTSR